MGSWGAVKCGRQFPSLPLQSDEWTTSAGGYFCETKPILGAADSQQSRGRPHDEDPGKFAIRVAVLLVWPAI
jgi:hypothetical protein